MNETAQDGYSELKWNADGLIPAIVQDRETGEVLMMAWMNLASFEATCESGHAVYWSRSRQRLWRKGESSGHVQQVHEIKLDCDGDTLLLRVTQVGGIACHTGRKGCFYRQLTDQSTNQSPDGPKHDRQGWAEVAPVIKKPAQIYGPDK